MNEILGGGFGSRLFQKSAPSWAWPTRSAEDSACLRPRRRLQVEVLTKSASTVDATKAALGEIAGLNTTPFTEEELKRAKDDILNSFLFRYDTKDKVLAERERLEFYGYPADYLETYKAALEKVTLADVTAAAKKYIHPDKARGAGGGQRTGDQARLDALDMGPVHPIDITIPQPPRPAGAAAGEASSEQG